MNKLIFFQNLVMQANQKAGIIISSRALALQGVTRSQAGNYSCVASNVEGDGDSNIVQLKIMCKCFVNIVIRRPASKAFLRLIARVNWKIDKSPANGNYNVRGAWKNKLFLICISILNGVSVSNPEKRDKLQIPSI